MTFKFNNTAVPVLPGRVRLNNMLTTHFSRNPKIAAFMKEYEFIREFGEGVDRMYRELEEGGWPKPIFRQDDFMLRASLVANQSGSETSPDVPNDPNPIQMDLNGQILSIIESNPSVSRRELAERLGISERRTRDILKEMQEGQKSDEERYSRICWRVWRDYQ